MEIKSEDDAMQVGSLSFQNLYYLDYSVVGDRHAALSGHQDRHPI